MPTRFPAPRRTRADTDALATGANDAALLLHREPHLTTPRGQAARLLLRFFARKRGMCALLVGKA